MSKQQDGKTYSYLDSGVDIEAGDALIKKIGPIANQTKRPGVLTGLGGFGALFELPLHNYSHPVLVSGTDGVGTKLLLANQMNQHSSIGIDLVAMCVNDIIVQGAEPLFFLDYYATGRLDVDTATQVISGIAAGCKMANTALIGGETAEMPGMYHAKDYDIAGFCVGIVEKSKLIDGAKIRESDIIIGLSSSGPHSNGYSLIRNILDTQGHSHTTEFHGKTLGHWLLEPTRIYVSSVLNVCAQIDVHGICHITGGGFLENLPRILDKHLAAKINQDSWDKNPIFDWLQQHGKLSPTEMYRTFNCGIGMMLVVDAKDLDTTMEILAKNGESAHIIGSIHKRAENSAQVIIS